MEKRFEQYCVIASKISGISISEIKEIVKYIEDKEFDNDEESEDNNLNDSRNL